MKYRLLYSDNSILTDLSTSMEKFYSDPAIISFVASEDKLYLGSRFPFSSFYVEMGDTVNSESSTMTVKYWDGTSFKSCVEVVDRTDALSKSGYVDFTPNLDYSWNSEHTNHSGESVTGLSDVVIYDHYWLEISFSADLTTDIDLKYIGQKFCSDDDLAAIYPQLDRAEYKAVFATGKATWNEQAVLASNEIMDRIKQAYRIDSGKLLLNRIDYKEACVNKLAYIIFRELGDDYEDDRLSANKDYNYHFNLAEPVIDTNKNAIQEEQETRAKQGYMSR